MTAEVSCAEVFADGLDFGYECVCGERIRGFASEPEAQAAADKHGTEH